MIFDDKIDSSRLFGVDLEAFEEGPASVTPLSAWPWMPSALPMSCRSRMR
jgi:hypothetical protein